MGYTANDLPNPRGELLIRGYTVFKGYFKDEQKTAEAFDGDWFRTGDICEIDSAGRIYIIDRVKNFFKVTPPGTLLRLVGSRGVYFTRTTRECVHRTPCDCNDLRPWRQYTNLSHCNYRHRS